jgi:hypothetical protein
MSQSELNIHELKDKWGPVLENEACAPIKDEYRKGVTAVLIENQHKFLKEAAHVNNAGASGLSSSAPATGGLAGYDPILISLVRRAMPNLIAYDLAGVQPMNGPTGLIFAMKAKYDTQGGTEALHNEAVTDFSGDADGVLDVPQPTDPLLDIVATNTGYTATTVMGDAVGSGMTREQAERLGGGGSGDGDFNEMAFSIEKVSVTAKSRALKAEYTTELAQDMKAIHGLDTEAELANILAAEILTEINREIVRKINISAKLGAELTTTAGVFDLDVDSNGRWSVEKFKGLLFQIERESNKIAKDTRRGKGNKILCSSDVASALSMAGVLNYDSALSGKQAFPVDDTGNTFVGKLNGRTDVYIDPYFESAAGTEYVTVIYRGASQYDAGMFYTPYVPLEMVRAMGENTFQPKIAFKTRYGLVANPFVDAGNGDIQVRNNPYFRIFRVDNLM